MAKGLGISGILNPESLAQVKGSHTVSYIAVEKIDEHKRNRQYNPAKIELLAREIEDMGLQTPVVLAESGERYVIISGHRRLAAFRLLYNEGKETYGVIPAIVRRGLSERQIEEMLYDGNLFTEMPTDAELAAQLAWKKERLQERKAAGEKISGKLLELIAEQLGINAEAARRMDRVNRTAIPEVQEAFSNGDMSLREAYFVSKKSEDEQRALYEKKNSGEVDYLFKSEGVHVPPESNPEDKIRGVHVPPESDLKDKIRGVHVPPESDLKDKIRGVHVPPESDPEDKIRGVHVPPESDPEDEIQGVHVPPESDPENEIRGVHVPPESNPEDEIRGVHVPPEIRSCQCIDCTCTGCHPECFGHCTDCDEPTHDCNAYQTGGEKFPSNTTTERRYRIDGVALTREDADTAARAACATAQRKLETLMSWAQQTEQSEQLRQNLNTAHAALANAKAIMKGAS